MKTRTSRSTLRTMQTNDSSTIALPAIGDAASIQRAIAAVLEAVAAGALEPLRARVLLYGLQLAATNAHRLAQSAAVEPVPAPVRPATIEATQQAPSEEHAVIVAESIVDTQAVASNAAEVYEDEVVKEPSAALVLLEEESHVEEEVAVIEEASPEEGAPPEAAAEPAGYNSGARGRLLALRQRAG